MRHDRDTVSVGAEIERLVLEMDALGDSPVKTHAKELARLLLSLYGSGLARVLDIVRTERGGPQAVMDRLAADPLVSSLLVLHDLHPDATGVRVTRALTALQPHLPAGLTLHLVGLEGDSAHIRADRTAPGRGSHSGTRLAIERAVREAAPELAGILIDGLDDAPDALIQIIRQGSPAVTEP